MNIGVSEICVIFVTIILVLVVTFFMNFIDDFDNFGLGWIVSSMGFGVCLAIILIQNGLV